MVIGDADDAGSLIVHDMDQYGYCYIVKWKYHDIIYIYNDSMMSIGDNY
jgi:hypothetical protein